MVHDIATFGYLLNLFVLIFLCQAACRCGDDTRFCYLFSSCFAKFVYCFQLYLTSVPKPVFVDGVVVISLLILFTEFRDTSLYGIHMFSRVGRHDTRM